MVLTMTECFVMYLKLVADDLHGVDSDDDDASVSADSDSEDDVDFAGLDSS